MVAAVCKDLTDDPVDEDAFLAEVAPLAKQHRGAAEYRPGRLL